MRVSLVVRIGFDLAPKTTVTTCRVRYRPEPIMKSHRWSWVAGPFLVRLHTAPDAISLAVRGRLILWRESTQPKRSQLLFYQPETDVLLYSCLYPVHNRTEGHQPETDALHRRQQGRGLHYWLMKGRRWKWMRQ
jgi:hypothetical protein